MSDHLVVFIGIAQDLRQRGRIFDVRRLDVRAGIIDHAPDDLQLWHHVLFRIAGKIGTRPGIEPGDPSRGLLGLGRGDSQLAGDLGESPFTQLLHVVAEDEVFQIVGPACSFHLEHQALPKVSSPDTGGFEGLKDRQHFQNSLGREACGEGEFFGLGRQITPVVDVSDE